MTAILFIPKVMLFLFRFYWLWFLYGFAILTMTSKEAFKSGRKNLLSVQTIVIIYWNPSLMRFFEDFDICILYKNSQINSLFQLLHWCSKAGLQISSRIRVFLHKTSQRSAHFSCTKSVFPSGLLSRLWCRSSQIANFSTLNYTPDSIHCSCTRYSRSSKTRVGNNH